MTGVLRFGLCSVCGLPLQAHYDGRNAFIPCGLVTTGRPQRRTVKQRTRARQQSHQALTHSFRIAGGAR